MIHILSQALTAITYFQPFMLLFHVDYLGMTVEELEPGCKQRDGRVGVVKEEVERGGDLRAVRDRVLVDIC